MTGDPIIGGPSTPPGHDEGANPLHVLLGGRRGAVESALPSVTFVTAYLVSGADLAVGIGWAMTVAGILAAARLWRREKPVRVLGGLAAACLAAVVAARTGNAADYFLPSMLANAASALIWAVSIAAGWPMLGVVLGFVLRQGTSWRRDPDVVRVYSRASWIWAASFVVRALVYTGFYVNGNLVGLGFARVLMGWPFVLIVITASWAVIRRGLPADHPGILRPRVGPLT